MRWRPALVLPAFVLIGNPLIGVAIMSDRKRTGFLASLTVAPISDLSIVFAAMGILLGHIGVEALGLTTLVGLIIITLSTYMILNSQALYERLSPLLRPFERRRPYREPAVEQQAAPREQPDVLVFGLGRYVKRLARRLRENGLAVLGVDFDPELVRSVKNTNLLVRFGDGADPDFLDSLPLAGAGWVVSTLPDTDSNRALLDALYEHRYGGEIVVVARDEAQGSAL